MGMRVYTEWAGEEVELQEETFFVNGWVGVCVGGLCMRLGGLVLCPESCRSPKVHTDVNLSQHLQPLYRPLPLRLHMF